VYVNSAGALHRENGRHTVEWPRFAKTTLKQAAHPHLGPLLHDTYSHPSTHIDPKYLPSYSVFLCLGLLELLALSLSLIQGANKDVVSVLELGNLSLKLLDASLVGLSSLNELFHDGDEGLLVVDSDGKAASVAALGVHDRFQD